MNSQSITVNATQFKAKAGDFLDQSQKRVIFITKYNKAKSVLLNTDYYQALKEQALKTYAGQLLDKARKRRMNEEEILKLVLEAEKWAKAK